VEDFGPLGPRTVTISATLTLTTGREKRVFKNELQCQSRDN
jgi:hypothetical protein